MASRNLRSSRPLSPRRERAARNTSSTVAQSSSVIRVSMVGPPQTDQARQGDFPFGSVIVREGRILARGHNLGRTNDDPTAHGEMVAIRRSLADHGSVALKGSTLYTSGEPCAMCMGAILWCGFGRLVYAASVEQLSTRIGQIMISSGELAAKAPFARISITGGVLAEEAMQLFSN